MPRPERAADIERTDQSGRPNRQREDAVGQTGKGNERIVRARIDAGVRRDGNQRRGDDAEHDRRRHPANQEHRGDREAEDRDERRRGAERSQRNERRRIRYDQAAIFQPDERQKRADAGRHRVFERQRNGAHDGLARTDERQRHEDDARNEHRAQRRLIRNLLTQHDGIGEIRVEAHSRRLGERIARDEGHQERAERRGERGDHEQFGKGVRDRDRVAEHQRVDEQHVRHRQERREAGSQFARHRRTGRRYPKVAVDLHAHGLARMRHLCTPWSASTAGALNP